jgi:hypothetical protein
MTLSSRGCVKCWMRQTWPRQQVRRRLRDGSSVPWVPGQRRVRLVAEKMLRKKLEKEFDTDLSGRKLLLRAEVRLVISEELAQAWPIALCKLAGYCWDCFAGSIL